MSIQPDIDIVRRLVNEIAEITDGPQPTREQMALNRIVDHMRRQERKILNG